MGFVLSFLILSANVFASDSSPRALVHLLDYLAQDYGGAVQNGKVISQSEFVEQQEFSNTVASMGRELKEVNLDPSITADLERLKELVAAKGPNAKVSELATQIKNRVIKLTGLPVAPTEWPSLAQGSQVFKQSCVNCHGVKGDGNGVSAKGLVPRPANFLDPSRMEPLSPFKVFNAVRIGVPGTAMVAQTGLSDKEIWAVAFYVMSLRHQMGLKNEVAFETLREKYPLEKVATLSDKDIPTAALRVVRTHSSDDDSHSSLEAATRLLDESLAAYAKGDVGASRAKALSAYLEGVEPVEPRLKASDPAMLVELESRMALVRSTIEGQKPLSTVESATRNAKDEIRVAGLLLNEGAPSPWLTFMIAGGILLREGFEAVLIIIAFLGVVRASGSKAAARWIHGGWIVALACGVATWFLSGWLMAISGAQRELLEGITSVVAVLVLLYMGFWLHRTTEIGRWTRFVNGRVKAALEGKNLIGLSAISFMAVFREAFETVLFLRALWLEGGMATKSAMLLGVLGALGLIFLLAWLILRSTTKLPIRKLFNFSSTLMTLLAVILIGKGIHSLQETGFVSITISPLTLRSDLIGFYPTMESTLAQLFILALALGLWMLGQRATIKAPGKAPGKPATT